MARERGGGRAFRKTRSMGTIDRIALAFMYARPATVAVVAADSSPALFGGSFISLALYFFFFFIHVARHRSSPPASEAVSRGSVSRPRPGRRAIRFGARTTAVGWLVGRTCPPHDIRFVPGAVFARGARAGDECTESVRATRPPGQHAESASEYVFLCNRKTFAATSVRRTDDIFNRSSSRLWGPRVLKRTFGSTKYGNIRVVRFIYALDLSTLSDLFVIEHHVRCLHRLG